MECMVAVNDPVAAGRGSRKLDGGLDRFGPRICEEHLIEIRHVREQPLGEDAGQGRDIHLYEVGQFGIEDALQRVTQRRMIAPYAEYPEAAQQIEIASALAIVEILPRATTPADIVADRAEDLHHLLIEMANMHRIAVTLMPREELCHIVIHVRSRYSSCRPQIITP